MKKQLIILTTFLYFNAFSQIPNYVPTNGLVGYWPFNGNAIDESVNSNDGIVNGASLTTDRNGIANRAFNFDGLDDFIDAGQNITFSNYSISLWVHLNSIPNTYNSLVSKISTNFQNYELRINDGAGATSFTWGDNSNWLGIASLLSFPIAEWHHIVVSYNSGNIVTLYLDGIIVSISTITSYIDVPGYHTYFGARPNTQGISNTCFFHNGKLDDIGIWNRALTQCEILDLYNAQFNSVAVNAGIDQTVCAGTSVSLSGTGANTYSWNNNVTNGIGFNPTFSNEYIVTGTDVNGCLGTDTVNVTVNNPSSSTLTETALDSYTLNGQNYTQSGTYTQVIPNAAGCDSTITLNLSLDFTGIKETQTGFTIAPNPTIDVVTITSPDALYDEYILFDPQGRKVLSGTLVGKTTELDLSKFARGNYLLQIGEKRTPIKLIKQ